MSADPRRATLGLMTKFWDEGQVKTRLGASIGMARAAAIHRLFVIHLCQVLSNFEGERVVCLTPSTRQHSFRLELQALNLDDRWQIMDQADGDLGNRMGGWFEQVLLRQTAPGSHAILVGADCPTITADLVAQASRQLHSHDMVVGPSMDGGYYLIGIAAPWIRDRFHRLFLDMPWSTEQVFAVTRQRIADAGLRCFELPMREDIDTVHELNRLRGELAIAACPSATEPTAQGWRELHLAIENILTPSQQPSAPVSRR